jgi:ribosomal protein L11 methyltransferase
VVARDRAEEATARMLELFPEGFAEESRGEAIELVAFTDPAGADRLRQHFADVRAVAVAAGWEDEWKRFHVPAIVGSLWVGPPWEQAPAELTKVIIDPGRAFGTGAHPTTRLCLEHLQLLEGGSLLDLGCGSGVLAIAAALLGFGPVYALDTDPLAVEATRQNAERNGVDLDVELARDGAAALRPVDVVVANIDLRTLDGLGSRLECRLVITSGYYETDRPTLAGFGHRRRLVQEKWAADLFERE